MIHGRIGRFLRAARNLMWMQLGLALCAVALAVWAVFAVRDLAAERDRLLERVAQLEARPAPSAPVAPPPAGPIGNSAVPIDLPPPPPALTTNQALPAPAAPAEADLLPPAPARTPGAAPTPLPPVIPAPGAGTADPAPARPGARTRPADCAATPADPRCRSGRWNDPGLLIERPDLPRPNIPRPTVRRPTVNSQGNANGQEPVG